jgi:hypothetical protein
VYQVPYMRANCDSQLPPRDVENHRVEGTLVIIPQSGLNSPFVDTSTKKIPLNLCVDPYGMLVA